MRRSSSGEGYGTMIFITKRSRCASGSGYGPSCSMGFCVASTKNGSGRGWLLRLVPRAGDLGGQKQIGEVRPLNEAELAMAGLPIVVDHFRPGDVGRHEVGGELNAAELERQAFGQRLHQKCLGPG